MKLTDSIRCKRFVDDVVLSPGVGPKYRVLANDQAWDRASVLNLLAVIPKQR
jgi:hypothetical protein